LKEELLLLGLAWGWALGLAHLSIHFRSRHPCNETLIEAPSYCVGNPSRDEQQGGGVLVIYSSLCQFRISISSEEIGNWAARGY
jgi:hypothetical protein